MSDGEWARAVRNLLDDAERVWRSIRRSERERREERLAPTKQLAMTVYEEEERSAGAPQGRMSELASLIAEQERDMRHGDRVWREGDASLTDEVLETAIGVGLFGETYVPARRPKRAEQLGHGVAAYRKRGCRCAKCKQAINEYRRRYRAANPDYVVRQNEARQRRRDRSKATARL